MYKSVPSSHPKTFSGCADIIFILKNPEKEAEAAAGLGTYFRPKDLDVVPDFEHIRPEPKTYETMAAGKF